MFAAAPLALGVIAAEPTARLGNTRPSRGRPNTDREAAGEDARIASSGSALGSSFEPAPSSCSRPPRSDPSLIDCAEACACRRVCQPNAKPGADCYPDAKSGAALPQNADNRTQGSTEREADPAGCGDGGHTGESTAGSARATSSTVPSSCSRPPRSESSSRLRPAMSSALAGSASSVGWRSATIGSSRSKLARMSAMRARVGSHVIVASYLLRLVYNLFGPSV